MKKAAFTLIELIFAIVVIAVSVISLPLLIATSSQGIEKNIIQEAIFASAAILNESAAFLWDENSNLDIGVSSFSRVVNTNSGGCLGGTPNRRIGHVNRQCLDNNATMPYNGGAFNNSINAAAHAAQDMFITSTASATSAATYKNQYKSAVTVNNCGAGGCVQFGTVANNPNLKEIQITILSEDETKLLVILRAYSANIGEVRTQSEIY